MSGTAVWHQCGGRGIIICFDFFFHFFSDFSILIWGILSFNNFIYDIYWILIEWYITIRKQKWFWLDWNLNSFGIVTRRPMWRAKYINFLKLLIISLAATEISMFFLFNLDAHIFFFIDKVFSIFFHFLRDWCTCLGSVFLWVLLITPCCYYWLLKSFNMLTTFCEKYPKNISE